MFVGVDMAKGDHYAQVISVDGIEVFDRAVANDEAAIAGSVRDASARGRVALVVDQLKTTTPYDPTRHTNQPAAA